MLEKALLTQAGDRSAWTLKLGATESGETSGSQAARKQWPTGDLGTSLVSESFL